MIEAVLVIIIFCGFCSAIAAAYFLGRADGARRALSILRGEAP